VKTYDSEAAMAAIGPMLAPHSSVLTLQNGIDSVAELAGAVGESHVIGGTTYIATALVAPGVIEQNGAHRRIVFGEVFGGVPRMSQRVSTLQEVLAGADIQAEAVVDGRIPIWEKFIMLAAVAGFTGAARLPIGPIREDPHARQQFLEACREIERLARAEGVPVADDVIDRIAVYIDGIPESMRSSLLIDLSAGKRIEVEALQGTVVRRAARLGLSVPVMATLYAVLRPWASPRA
jgi:2-dehydropantoate 2-reductase